MILCLCGNTDKVDDGKAHAQIACWIMVLLTVLAFPLVFLGWEVAVGLIAGAFIGWWLTPDIDHMGTTHEEYRARRKLGVLGGIWVGYWQPYAQVAHRSLFGHSWVGTLARAAYLFGPTLFLIWVATRWIPPWSWGYVSGLAAWLIQDSAHYYADGLGITGLKRWIGSML